MKKGISQEVLKLIACVTMLLDHFGAICAPARDLDFWQFLMFEGTLYSSVGMYYALRCIGRLAFPIFCFLLAEGAHYTKNPHKYALRLGIGVLLAELPFDFAFYGGWTWEHQSVMITLLLGYGALLLMKRCDSILLKLAAVVPFIFLAEWMCTDYGGYGVAMIALFGLTRELPRARLLQLLGLLAINGMMQSATLQYLLGIPLSIQLLAPLAMIPIALYSGKKATANKVIQWGFYLFYPVHMAVLWLLIGGIDLV